MEIRWDWIVDNFDTILEAVWQHMILVIVPLVVGFVISLGLAIWAIRQPRVYGPTTVITGILYTIPSLAAFALLVPILGFSMLVAFIPLTTYTLLILFRNIVAGFQAVPREVLEAADGMGYRPRERLLRVELPLAVPLMIAGVRLAAVTLIGLATVASILGSSFGGLGQLITEGLQTFFPTKYVLGGVLSVLLAFIVDIVLVRVERMATPWARARADRAAGA
jgi:osmoprotectant transport system permease protein